MHLLHMPETAPLGTRGPGDQTAQHCRRGSCHALLGQVKAQAQAASPVPTDWVEPCWDPLPGVCKACCVPWPVVCVPWPASWLPAGGSDRTLAPTAASKLPEETLTRVGHSPPPAAGPAPRPEGGRGPLQRPRTEDGPPASPTLSAGAGHACAGRGAVLPPAAPSLVWLLTPGPRAGSSAEQQRGPRPARLGCSAAPTSHCPWLGTRL